MAKTTPEDISPVIASLEKRSYKKKNAYPSVTQVLNVLRKAGLEYWFKINTAAFCDEKSAKGKEIGTQAHDAIQAHIEEREVKVETQYADEVMNALKSFMLFKKEHPEITLHKSEMEMTDEVHKYNGTLDVTAEIAIGDIAVVAVGDWKTGEAKDNPAPRVYDEHKAQLSAYIKAYNRINGQNVEKGFIVVLAKDKVAYALYVMEKDEIDAEFENVFLPALKISNYQRRDVLRKAEEKNANISKNAV